MYQYLTLQKKGKILGTVYGSDVSAMGFKSEFRSDLSENIANIVSATNDVESDLETKLFCIVTLSQGLDPDISVASLVSAASPLTATYSLMISESQDPEILGLIYEDSDTGDVFIRRDEAWEDLNDEDYDNYYNLSFVPATEKVVAQYDTLGNGKPLSEYEL